MNTINIQLAGYVVCIRSKYRSSSALYEDFRTDAKADSYITVTDDDIDFIRAKEYNLRAIRVIDSSILSKIAEELLEYSVLLMHGAVIAYNGEAYMFTAPSGTGKTTHILKWLNQLPDSFVLNGDKPFIRFNDDNILACGSPWAGKEDLYTNTMIPLKCIVFMERDENNHIEQISFTKAFPLLLQQVYHSNDEAKMRKTIRVMQRMNGHISFWQFRCNNLKEDSFEVAYNALVRDRK